MLKKVFLFIGVVLVLAACSMKNIPSISQDKKTIKREENQTEFPFECEINAEEWILIAWDKKDKWQNLSVFLEQAEDSYVAFQIKQNNDSEVFVLQEGNSCSINLKKNVPFTLAVQIDGEISQSAQIKGSVLLS